MNKFVFLLFLFFITLTSAFAHFNESSNRQVNINNLLRNNKESIKTYIMKLFNLKNNNPHESYDKVENKSDEEFKNGPGIFQLLSTSKHWRSVHRKFRSEIKFANCISNHFLKPIVNTTPSFSNNSNESESLVAEVNGYDYPTNNTSNGDVKYSNTSRSSANRRSDRDTRASNRRNSLQIFNGSFLSKAISLMKFGPTNSVAESFLLLIGVYLKRWIDNLTDSYGVLGCARNYLRLLFSRYGWIRDGF